MSAKIDRFRKLSGSFSQWLNWVAGAGLVVMLGLTAADILGVKFFNYPIPGAIEFVGFLGVVVVAFGIAYTQVLRGHIQVEFFITKLPKRMQGGVTAFVSLLGIVLFALLAWQSYHLGHNLQVSGEVSMTQRIPFYPFVYAIAFCCLSVCLVLSEEFLRSFIKMVKK